MRYLVVASAIFFCISINGAVAQMRDDTFKTQQAMDAQARYNASIRNAQETYLNELKAINSAPPSSNAGKDERVSVVIAELEQGLGLRPPESDTRQITYATKDGWVDTGIPLKKGDRVWITVKGTYSVGNFIPPVDADGSSKNKNHNECLKQGCPLGRFLVAVSGQPSRYYEIGKKGAFTANSSGTLLVGTNDSYVPNNTGEVQVTVDFSK